MNNTIGKCRLLAFCVVLLMVAGTALAAGCNGGEPQAVSTASEALEDAAPSARGAAEYPRHYETLHQTRVNAKGIVVGHAAEHLREICEAPTVRDQNGSPVLDGQGNVQMVEAAYNPATDSYDINLLTDEQLAEMNLKSGCVACKTTHFNDIYAQQGAAAFGNVYNAEARAIVDGDYFDCAMCHEGDPGTGELEPHLMFFPALGAGLSDHLDPRNGVCAQCHNSYDYRSSIKTEDDLREFRAYRNGHDVDSLFETCWEDGVNIEWDAETGIPESYVLHPTIELFLGTKMQLLGVTCVDCHMPQVVEDDGEYTDHFSAKSPLESAESLEYCLNCHERQGIATAADMVEYTRARQAELAGAMAELHERNVHFREALEQAVAERGADDASLDAPKKLYAKATWYEKCLETGPNESPGSQAAMLEWRGIVEKANATCDEGVALLG